MSYVDAQIPVAHQSFVRNTSTPVRHGEAQEGTYADAVTRYVYQVYPANWQSLRPDPINIETLDRTITDLIMDVPDPTVYKDRDKVTIKDKDFIVQGDLTFDDWGNGLQIMSEYDELFGATILIKRVT